MPSGFTAKDTAIFKRREKLGQTKTPVIFAIKAKLDNRINYLLDILFNIRKHNNKNSTIVELTKLLESSIRFQRAKLEDFIDTERTLLKEDYLIKEYTKAKLNTERIIDVVSKKRDLFKLTNGFKYFKSPSNLDCIFNPYFCEDKSVHLPQSKLLYYSPKLDPFYNKSFPKKPLYSFMEISPSKNSLTQQKQQQPTQKYQKLSFWYSWDDYKEDIEETLLNGGSKLARKFSFADKEKMKKWEKYHNENDLYSNIKEVELKLCRQDPSKELLWKKRVNFYLTKNFKKHFYLD